jgi:hypothetical protein
LAGIRADAATARAASKRQDHARLTAARASATQRLKELDEIVKQYEAAGQETGEAAIERLRNGRQLLAGILALITLRARARVMVNGLPRLH